MGGLNVGETDGGGNVGVMGWGKSEGGGIGDGGGGSDGGGGDDGGGGGTLDQSYNFLGS